MEISSNYFEYHSNEREKKKNRIWRELYLGRNDLELGSLDPERRIGSGEFLVQSSLYVLFQT